MFSIEDWKATEKCKSGCTCKCKIEISYNCSCEICLKLSENKASM